MMKCSEKKKKRSLPEEKLIKEACNHLPIGICIGTMEGIPRLTNEKMQELAKIVCGASLVNTEVFWHDLERFEGNAAAEKIRFTDTPSIKLKDGRIYNFTHKTVVIRNSDHVELLARDVTERYELSEQIGHENEQLKLQAEQLDKLRENIATLNRDEEVLESKMRVHYELGRVIMSSRRYLMGTSNIEKKQLIDMWKDALGVFEDPLFSEKASFDFIGEIKSMAESNGCRLTFEGKFDSDNDLLVAVVREGLVNAVRHGSATEVCVKVETIRCGIESECGEQLRLTITDNGIGLKEKHGRGGLADLEAKLAEHNGVLGLENRQDAIGACLSVLIPL